MVLQGGFWNDKELRTGRRAESVQFGRTSSPIIASLLSLKFPDGETVVDLTYGRGSFWADVVGWNVIGFDIAPKDGIRARADARHVPLRDAAVDVAVFDPPYVRDRQGRWWYADRYGQLDAPRISRLMPMVAAEMRRVARLGAIVKVQDVIDGHDAVWHSFEVHAAFHELGVEPAEQLVFVPTGGRGDGWNWQRQAHLRRVHAFFYVFEWAPRRRAKDRARGDVAALNDGRPVADHEVRAGSLVKLPASGASAAPL